MRKAAFLVLAATFLLAACGGGKGGTNASGAKVFASARCGGCHTLSAAKSTGQTGPNLDAAKPSYDAVVRQVSNGVGGIPRSKVASIARSLCTGKEISKTYFLLYQCVHGLGHGLMIYSLNDLPYSLHVCDQLATMWDRSSCTGGVFMQNFLPGPMQL